MNKLLVLLSLIVFLFSACSQQITEEISSESPLIPQKTQSFETTPQPLTEQTESQTPEPTSEPSPKPYAVSEAFVNHITSDMPYILLEGLNKEIYEPLLDYYHSFNIVEEENHIVLRFMFEDASYTQTIKDAYEAKWGSLENGCMEFEDSIGMCIGGNDDETCVEFWFAAAEYPTFKTPEYYTEQIHLPDMPEDALLVSKALKGFEWGEKIVYECEYELPEDCSQTIIKEYESKLSELVGYQTYDGMWDDTECMEYRALLAPGAEVYAVSTQEMFLFEVAITPLTILNSGFAYEAAAEPANTLLSEEAKKIFSNIEADDKYISIKRGENVFCCNMFFEFFENADDIAAFIAEEYGVDEALHMLQEGQDIEIPFEQGNITVYDVEYPQVLRIIVDAMDEESMKKMSEVFVQYPDDLLPEFPESIPCEFDGDFICVSNGYFSYYRTYAIDKSDYRNIINYFEDYIEKLYDEAWVEEYSDRSTSISASVDNIHLEVFVDKGDEFSAPSVEIRLVR